MTYHVIIHLRPPPRTVLKKLMMEENGEELKDSELSRFLAKVEEVGALVSDLRASDGSAAAGDALRRADEYLGQQGEDRIVQDRSIINTGGEQSADVHSCRASEKEQFMKTLEEDARERGERRKEREAEGREHKRRGNEAFRAGQFQSAAEEFSVALRHTPWDTSLYTNRALAYNRLGRYDDAIVDCDAAMKLEPCTLKAYVQKAKALSSLQRAKEAEECYTEAEKLFPNKADTIAGLRSTIGP